MRIAKLLPSTLIISCLALSFPLVADDDDDSKSDKKKDEVQITGVFTNTDLNEIRIVGKGFSSRKPPAVQLENYGNINNQCAVSGAEILCSFPSGLPQAGDYLLTVSSGKGKKKSDSYNLTVGAVGPQGPSGAEGPQGEQGEPGPVGPNGETGPTGPAGPIGPQGPQGETGLAGVDGRDGLDADEFYRNQLCADGFYLAGFDSVGALVCRPLPDGSDDPVPDANLVASLELDGNGSDDASSSIQLGPNDLVIPSCLTFVPGIFGQAANFDGTCRAQISGNANINTSVITRSGFGAVSLWIRPTSIDTSTNDSGQVAHIFAYFKPRPFDNQFTAVTIVHSNGDLRFDVAGTPQISSGVQLVPGQDYHLVLTWNLSSFDAYVDGVQVISDEPLMSRLSQDVGNPYIGGYIDDRATKFTGLIDKLKVYNTELSSSDVLDLFENP